MSGESGNNWFDSSSESLNDDDCNRDQFSISPLPHKQVAYWNALLARCPHLDSMEVLRCIIYCQKEFDDHRFVYLDPFIVDSLSKQYKRHQKDVVKFLIETEGDIKATTELLIDSPSETESILSMS